MAQNQFIQRWLPHIVAMTLFLVLSLLYFSPVLEGKKLQQSDTMQWEGMSHEVRSYNEETGENALWTNAMFGGMPTYQIAMKGAGNFLHLARHYALSVIPEPANYIFMALVCFYILLIVLQVSPPVAVVGALGYGFATYMMLILEAGHVTKTVTLALTPLVLAGVFMAYRRNWLAGTALTALALALNIGANHLQITYYTFLILGVFFIALLIDAIRNHRLPQFAKTTLVLGVAVLLGIGANATRLWTTYEYAQETIRGGTELTKATQTSGLDRDYALAWSYGVMETMTLLVPRFYGGASAEPIGKDYEMYKYVGRGADTVAPMYWGAQPFTGGPIYHGAVVCFLFVLGCFLIRGWFKWAAVAATLLSILLAWGKNMGWFTDLFFYYFPMYNKFRVVSMTLVIAQCMMPLLGAWALQHFLIRHPEVDSQANADKKRALIGTTAVLSGILLFFLLFGSSFLPFESDGDERYKQVIDILRADRLKMFRADIIRSWVLVLATAGVLWVYYKGWIKSALITAAVIGVLLLGDLWLVDKSYLNNRNFVSAAKAKAIFEKDAVDEEILKDTDPDFRVLNLTANTFNDAITSYYHKSLGGYHGAKLGRYQDLIEYHLSKNNINVINMLNTKYVIVPDEQAGGRRVQRNPDALGNAWWVSEIKTVQDADAEIAALTDFNPRQTAIVDERFASALSGLQLAPDSTASIRLTSYAPNRLTYETQNNKEGLAVFSEIYYNGHKGWNAYIDGQPAPHLRANYVLRAMRIPAGKHTIEFKFEPAAYAKGEMISYTSSALVLLLCGVVLTQQLRRRKELEESE